jgi:nicotinamidase-related amidase
MPVTTIDAKTALIVIDLQKSIVSLPTVHPISPVVERSCALIDAFRQHDLPVVLVNVTGGAPGRTEQPRRFATFPEGFADLITELNKHHRDQADMGCISRPRS